MPAQRRKSNKKTRNGSRKSTVSSSTILKYNGSAILPKSMGQAKVEPLNFSTYIALNASVGGTVDLVYGTGLVTSANDWTSTAAIFNEYRVLAMELEFQPIVSYTSSYPPVYWVLDRNASGTLGSYVVCANHESANLKSSRYPHKVVIKMDGPDEAVWTSTSTTFSWGWIKVFGTNFATSQNVGLINLRFLVQMRGKK
jgi:hypothetical protein